MVEPPHVRFSLEKNQLYGWTMYPGYGGQPYQSPILVYDIEPHGERTLKVNFLNIFYAVGVQRMAYQLRTLRREKTYLVAEQLVGKSPSDRDVIIECLTREWMRRALPRDTSLANEMFDDFGKPVRATFLALASSY